MSDEKGQVKRVYILAAALTVVLIAAVAAGVVWWRGRNVERGGLTNPILVGRADGGVDTPGIVVSSSSGSSGESTAANDFMVRLSAGQALPQAVEAVPVAAGDPLTLDEIAAILARLPELQGETGDQVDFKLPVDSPPPPRPGETITQTFPLPQSESQPVEVTEGPLEVVRYGPEGEIALAPFINVTFNQPMAPLATLEQLAAEGVPVQVEPPLEGTWKWIGTKTLRFEYDSDLIDRLPMATEYRVTIPAGTQSQTGGTLAADVSWTMTTPAVQLTSSYPNGDAQPLEPVMAAVFDQRINPAAVLETVQVTAGGREVAIRLATDEEIEADERANRITDRALESRWLAFVAQELLPADTDIQVTVGPNTPSAEGPLTTTEAQQFSFRTYAPLRIEDQYCSYYDDCPPLSPWTLVFNNPLDADAYQESMIEIDPALEGATVSVAGRSITIRGVSVGRTTYKVTIDGSLQDTFGQTLGDSETLTFKVGSASSVLVGPSDFLVTLDPAAEKPVLSVYAINFNRLKVRAYQVEPSDWAAFNLYLREQYDDDPPDLPGRLALDETVRLEAPADKLTEARIDLSEALEGDTGHLIVVIEPPADLFDLDRDRYSNRVLVWVQVTQIGLDALADHEQLLAWTTALADGAPLAGVSIEAGPGAPVATTDEGGVAHVELSTDAFNLLVARQGDDTAILPRYLYYWGDEGWKKYPLTDELRWYTFDDRAMYRPEEEVHLKGWLRRIGAGQTGDVELIGGDDLSVTYTVSDAQGNEIVNGRADVNALGGFDFSFDIPEAVNLGYANVYFKVQGSGLSNLQSTDWYHQFQIQEFRRPEFEVGARNETTGPYVVGDHAVVAVEASYYAGGALPNAEVTWTVSSSPSSYSPPNWSDFTFGAWTPWWYWGPVYVEASYDYFWEDGVSSSTDIETFPGTTDAAGEHYLRLDFDPTEILQPQSVLAEATVMDVNRQAWAATTSLLVHPADWYVGIRSDRTFVERGDPLDIEVIVTDIDGNAISGATVEVETARLAWQYRGGSWGEQPVDVQSCTLTSGSEPQTCTFTTTLGGTYQVTATVTDSQGRKNQSQFTRWVTGGQRPPSRDVEQETVTLIPDKESYQPGDVAQILVQPPFSPAEGLLTIGRDGIVSTRRFTIDDETITLDIPIEEGAIPNLTIQVDLVGAAPRVDDQGETLEGVEPRPAYATGQLTLSVPPLQRELHLELTPEETALEPGGETTLDLVLTDAAGEPVAGAELAVVVVDEAILALTNYQMADPLAIFYQTRSLGIQASYGRDSIVLANPEDIAGGELGNRAALAQDQAASKMVEGVVEESEMAYDAAGMAMPTAAPLAAEGASDGAEPIQVRSDFNPLATFAPAVHTDNTGRASVTISLPDNLTRYRIMVVAVAGGTQFGVGEANLTARLPLMVRPSAPRFLNFGDQTELPVVLQNQTDAPMAVQVVVQATNLELLDGQGKLVTVPANDRIEVRFPATTELAGTARLQIAAVSGDYADAAEVELPVYTPATTEAFATYGVLDEGAIAQPVAALEGVFPQFGGLEINTSSTALQALTDAVLYLVSYRYDCSEQLASRVLAVAALRDVLDAFEADGLPTPEEIEAAVLRDLDQLQGMQNSDGGWPYWQRYRETVPYNSIHVAHALARAEQMGFAVDADMRARSLDYLRDIENKYPHWYSQKTRWALSAYALYVRDLMGDGDAVKARSLYTEAGLDNLSLEADAFLWQVMLDDPASSTQIEEIRRHLNNRAVETAGAANFTTDYGEDAYLLLHSDRRTDAIILDAYIAGDPESDLIPKIVNGLLAHRTRGRWSNTQENVFILLALDRYFETYEAQEPEFVAQMWLGDTYVAEHAYSGRTTERQETTIPMSYLIDGGEQDLIISKEGPGRLYYRLGLRYAPTDLELDPLDMGFVVQRTYEAVDDPADVVREEDGTWTIRAGARVRVKLTMVADNRRYHVALVDPLPAGLEIVNPALAVSGDVPQDPSSSNYRYGWWWWGPWYEHQNMRDERAEAFASLLWDGVYSYSYVARATTPGTYVAPPAKAEEMYSPEVFGRSASDIVVIE